LKKKYGNLNAKGGGKKKSAAAIPKVSFPSPSTRKSAHTRTLSASLNLANINGRSFERAHHCACEDVRVALSMQKAHETMACVWAFGFLFCCLWRRSFKEVLYSNDLVGGVALTSGFALAGSQVLRLRGLGVAKGTGEEGCADEGGGAEFGGPASEDAPLAAHLEESISLREYGKGE
jgi:hypothetical protein